MKPLKPFRETPGYCGPASLKILLSHYGKEYSEAELAKLCETTADYGTDHDKMVRTLNVLGFETLEKDHATIHELRELTNRETPVIVGWFSINYSQYSVVYNVTDTIVSMMDPQLDEGIARMKISEFEAAWYDFDGPNNERFERWMLAITGSRTSKA